MANGLQLNTATVFAGLGTSTFTVVTAGLYTVQIKATIPCISAGSSSNSSVTTGGSGLSIVVNKNGSAILTIANPSPTQPLMGGSVSAQFAAADVITVVMSSSAAADQGLNVIKSIINLYQGE